MDAGAGDGGHDHQHDAGPGVGHGKLGIHIHNIQFWGSTKDLLIGAHEGVYRTEAGAEDLVTLAEEGDYMSVMQDPINPDTYWASGHWAAGGFGNWGFIESTDGGTTWAEISLTGTVDFHQIAVSDLQESVVVGTYAGQYYVSDDSGRNWDTYGGAPSPTGLLVEGPSSPVLLVASASGIDRVTFPAGTADTVVFDDVSGLGGGSGRVLYGTADGDLHLCDADVTNCVTVTGPSLDATLKFLVDPDAEGTFYVLTAGSQVFLTEDDGDTWELIIDQS